VELWWRRQVRSFRSRFSPGGASTSPNAGTTSGTDGIVGAGWVRSGRPRDIRLRHGLFNGREPKHRTPDRLPRRRRRL